MSTTKRKPGPKKGTKHGESPLEKKFVEEYVRGCSAFDAAIRAGYSPGNAKKAAARLVSLPRVQEAVHAARLDIVRNTGITPEFLLQEVYSLYLDCRKDLTVKGAIAGATKCLELMDRATLGIFTEKKQLNVKHDGPAPVFVVMWEGEDAEALPLPEGRVAEYQPPALPAPDGAAGGASNPG